MAALVSCIFLTANEENGERYKAMIDHRRGPDRVNFDERHQGIEMVTSD